MIVYHDWRRGLMAALAPLLAASVAMAADVDIKFVHVSDPHYVVDYAACASKTALVDRINALPGLTFPNSSEKVGNILGVIATGDLIDAGSGGNATREAQWANFIADYGLNGTDGRLNVPVYEGWGNHDQDSWFATVTNRIAVRNAMRPGLVNRVGPHYSWNWGPVHVVQMNIRVGHSLRYNPANSFTFLTNDLAVHVGNSRRPVVIAHHIPVPHGDTGEWPAAEQTEYYNAITNYNVVAILWGHVGGGSSVARWNSKVRTVFTSGGRDTVLRITREDTGDPNFNGRLRIYQRTTTGWGTSTTDLIYIPDPPRINRVMARTGGGFNLELSGDSGVNYTLQASSDLVTWQDLYTTNAPVMPMAVPAPSSGPGELHRFFRARLGP